MAALDQAPPATPPFTVHASFASRTDYKLLRLLQREVEKAGGVFTGGHIANADTWKEVWGGKCGNSDRVVVVYNKDYRKFLSAAIVWEHGQIY